MNFAFAIVLYMIAGNPKSRGTVNTDDQVFACSTIGGTGLTGKVTVTDANDVATTYRWTDAASKALVLSALGCPAQ